MNQPAAPAPGQQPRPIPVKSGGGGMIALVIVGVLMLAVAVIGILAAIAIPNFIKFQCRSKQSEAKTNLKGAYVAMESYFAENDAYTKSFEAIRWQPMGGGTTRYEYKIVEADDDSFVIEARGTGDMEGDLWRIDETLEVENVESRCH